MSKIPIGVSECLLGEPVRFDGGHKHNRYLTDVLADYLEFRPVCPEVAIGLGVPRRPIRLIATDTGDRVRGSIEQRLDVTDALTEQADLAADRLPDICGYIFMQKSPSCGVFGMKRYSENGQPLDSQGRGAYAARLMTRMPLIPVEEAGRLNDAGLRDNFITRVYALHDWKQSVAAAPSARKLVAFYSRYKYQVMAHHLPSYQTLGKRVADLKSRSIEEVCADFIRQFMDALCHIANRKGNTNAMLHLRGYLKGRLNPEENAELDQLITAYKQGELPLVVPITLLKHHLLKVDNPYLKQQSFWSPHPEKLGLRNQIVHNL